MIDHSGAADQGQRHRSGESKGVKEWKHSKNAIAFRECKTLRQLCDVGTDVVVREHDAFGFARAAA